MRSIVALPTVVVAIALALHVSAAPTASQLDARGPPEQNNAGWSADYGSAGPPADGSAPDSPSSSSSASATPTTSKRALPFDLLPTPPSSPPGPPSPPSPPPAPQPPTSSSSSSTPAPTSTAASSHKKHSRDTPSIAGVPFVGPLVSGLLLSLPAPVHRREVSDYAPLVGSKPVAHESVNGGPDPAAIIAHAAHVILERAPKSTSSTASPSPSPSSPAPVDPVALAGGVLNTVGKMAPAQAPAPKMEARAQRKDNHKQAAKKAPKQQKAPKKNAKQAPKKAATKPKSQSHAQSSNQNHAAQPAASNNRAAQPAHAASAPPASAPAADDSAPGVNAGADSPSEAPAGGSAGVGAQSHPPARVNALKQSRVDPVIPSDPFMMARGMPIF